jgi:hypothetical protein
MNLEQDFIKLENNGDVSYYGYNLNLKNKDESNSWSIRRITGTSSLDVEWSNKSKLSFTSKWNDKEYYFEDPIVNNPNWSSTGVTWSYDKLKNSFGEYTSLNLEFDDALGVDNYTIEIKNSIDSNKEKKFIKSNGTNKINFNFRGFVGVTYSLKLKGDNSYGEISSNIEFYTI